MHSCQSVLINAPREEIFETVRDLAKWPEILPHYRAIHFKGQAGDHRIVEMAATRTGIPISWMSEFWTDEAHLELHFTHIRRWTKGMKVVWTLTPTRDGTRVEIVHDLRFRFAWLAWLAEPVIGGFFIANIAAKTLARFKEYCENGQ